MAELTVISGQQARRAFERACWLYERCRGDDMMLMKPAVRNNLSIPDHRELDRGALRKLIARGGITIDDFVGLLR